MSTGRAAAGGLLALTLASAILPGTAMAEDPHTTIVGGQEQTEPVAWISALHNSGRFTCTSALVAPHWVLTAAHCVEGGGDFSVRIGSLQRSSGGEQVGVSEVVMAPGFDWPNSDIALLRLERDVAIEPVTLATPEDLADGQEAKVMGWGSENADWSGPLPENLKYAVGTADIDCATGGATPLVICTQTDGSIAGGDSGGPVLVKSAKTGEMVHAGVAAMGNKPAGDGWAGYTDTTKHQQWYDQTVAS